MPQTPSFQASGKFSGSIPAAAMTAGGADKLALTFSIPAGIGSPKILAGPESSRKFPFSTDALTDARTESGYSFFGLVKIPGLEKLRAFARYDYFNPDVDVDEDAAKLFMGGFSYDVHKSSMAILDYERIAYERNYPWNSKGYAGRSNPNTYEDRIQLVYQISF